MPSSAHFDAWYAPDVRERADAADGRHLQDVSGALLAQDRQRGLGDPQRTEQVGLELGAGLGLGELLDHAELAVAGVVDDDVEAAEVLVRPRDGGEVGVAVGDVELRSAGPVAVALDEVLEGGGVAGGGGDGVAALQRGDRSTRGRNPRCAGDEPGLAHVSS